MGGVGKWIVPVAATVIGGLVGGPAGAALGYSAAAGTAAGAIAGGALAVGAADQQRKAAHKMQDATNREQEALGQALRSNPLPVMPTPDDQKVKQASIAEQVARRGRASTILTSPGDKLGS